MRVLFLAFEFPPVNTAGMHRSAKLAKYLPGFGIEPIVVTLHPEDAATSFGARLEPALMDDLPEGLVRYTLRYPEVGSSSRLVRFARIWARSEDPIARTVKPELLRLLDQIARLHKPSAVYVSMPPFSAGGLALTVAKALDLPLVVDMRDAWSRWCVGPFSTYLHWALVARKERRLFQSASAVVTVTSQLADILRESHPEVPPGRFHVVPNGYDGALGIPETLEEPPHGDADTVDIGYVGSFYYSPEARATATTRWWQRPGHKKLHYYPAREDWLYRSPHFFLRALSELRRQNPALGNRIRFSLIGEKPDWLDRMLAEFDLGDVVHCHGRVEHERVLELARELDAQLCTSVKVQDGEDFALASKTFDYVRAGRPILGFVTRGAQKDFLDRSGLAVVADPDDLAAGIAALAKIARGGFLLHPDRKFLETFNRQTLAGQMAEIIRGVMPRQAD